MARKRERGQTMTVRRRLWPMVALATALISAVLPLAAGAALAAPRAEPWQRWAMHDAAATRQHRPWRLGRVPDALCADRRRRR